MHTIKTAISIQKSLFDQAEDLARKKKVSRSKLFVMALEDYIERQHNQDLLTQINAAYAEEPDLAERTLRRKARRQQRRLVEDTW